MTISPGQAAAALQEVERTERRTRLSGGYAAASPHLILWGIVWAIGYGACAVVPPQDWGLVWLPLVAIGAIGSGWLGSRAKAAHGAGSGGVTQSLMMALVVFVFFIAADILFRPRDPLVFLVFPSLVTGLVYALIGLVARLPRFAWIGAGILVLPMAGYLATPAWTALWIALAGGGGLILGGLWLKKV